MRSQHPELARPPKRCLGALATVSWPCAPAWGSLEPPRRDGENAQKTGKTGGKWARYGLKRATESDHLVGPALIGTWNGAMVVVEFRRVWLTAAHIFRDTESPIICDGDAM